MDVTLPPPQVYHEKQQRMHCAIHATNNLLQVSDSLLPLSLSPSLSPPDTHVGLSDLSCVSPFLTRTEGVVLPLSPL
jgi:hypothetical protein